MKLVTFQSMDAYESLIKNGYLETNPSFINQEKVGYAYSWIVAKMNKKVKNNYNTKYPIWCWVKCYNGICPKKRKGTPIKGYDVKITFNKKEEDVFITDFRRYSFLLNNMFIPKNRQEKELFDNELKKYSIKIDDLKAYVRKDKYDSYRTDQEFLNICEKIKDSFDNCITKNSDILQGCVWRIDRTDVEKIELLNNDGYSYGSINYVRANGERKDWIKEFYKLLDNK